MNKPAPLTQNQKAYYDRCKSSWFNVAEGGKRGGKNVLNTLVFCLLLEHHPDKLHLAAGVSIATAKLNIIDCNGYGLLNYFEGRCREGTYKNRDCLYVQTLTGEKIVLVSGGGKDGDAKLIQGNTYGMAYITEANLCHATFIKEVFDRTLSSKDRKVFHDLNPKAANHWYYTDILKYHEDMQRKDSTYGYNYGHFTIADNMSISGDQLRSLLKTYDKTSIWYERDMLGRRKAVEGLVYSFDPRKSVTSERPAGTYYISIDYGTLNPFSAGLWSFDGQRAVRIREYYHDGRTSQKQLTDEEYYAALEKLAGNLPIERVIIDPSAASFIATIRRHGRFSVKRANNDVLNGIRRTADLLNSGKILIHESCVNAIREFELYVWDDKSGDDRPVKQNDHAMDDIRYFCYTVLRRLR